MTFFSGMSADELLPFDQTYNANYIQFQQNKLLPSDPYVNNSFWQNSYSYIYAANSIIDGLTNHSGVSEHLKQELIGEAKFIRAFCNFYLVNLFGDIPLVTTINYHKTSLLERTLKSNVYQAIISDLIDAQNKLSEDYSKANGQRIIPNKWASTALLARVYLYTEDWDKANAQATDIINNSSLYALSNNLDNIYLTNSSESILQLQQNYKNGPRYATPEGYQFIPYSSFPRPFAYLSTQMLNSFEPGDQRRVRWIDSTLFEGVTYYFPFKYKIGPDQANNGPYSEYYTVLRLAEQYLIRAEARVQQGDPNAIDDLNAIRNRAGLADYTGVINKPSLLNAIMHERQIELFGEWGHRWLDLKRWGIAAKILSANKGFTVDEHSLLYPIPQSELQTDPNLTQNPGY